MRTYLIPAVAIAAMLSLAACGTNPGCRTLTGAGIGAAGGAVLGAVGGNPALGALAGGIAGGAAGGLSSPHQVNLGNAPCD